MMLATPLLDAHVILSNMQMAFVQKQHAHRAIVPFAVACWKMSNVHLRHSCSPVINDPIFQSVHEGMAMVLLFLMVLVLKEGTILYLVCFMGIRGKKCDGALLSMSCPGNCSCCSAGITPSPSLMDIPVVHCISMATPYDVSRDKPQVSETI